MSRKYGAQIPGVQNGSVAGVYNGTRGVCSPYGDTDEAAEEEALLHYSQWWSRTTLMSWSDRVPYCALPRHPREAEYAFHMKRYCSEVLRASRGISCGLGRRPRDEFIGEGVSGVHKDSTSPSLPQLTYLSKHPTDLRVCVSREQARRGRKSVNATFGDAKKTEANLDT